MAVLHMKSNHTDDIYSYSGIDTNVMRRIYMTRMTRNTVVCYSDSLMNMGVHLHILSCFWRRYRENALCVMWSVYWLLSSYIIDVKNWQCFLCSDTVLAHRYRHQNIDFGQNMFFLASVAEQFHLINFPVCLYEQRSENTDVIVLVKSEAHPFWLYLGVFWTVNSKNSNNCLYCCGRHRNLW